jgi:hypothetical protein
VRDWITQGCVTPHGRIRLPAVRACKKYSIEAEDLEVFEARLRHGASLPVLDLP